MILGPSSSPRRGPAFEGRRAWPLRFAVAAVGASLSGAAVAAPPTVVEGYRVDADTYAGYKIWKSQNCGGCHGLEQQGLTAPSLIDSLQRLSKDEFKRTVLEGRPAKRMPSFGHVPSVAIRIENLYAYLKGRADGVITQAQVEPLP